MENNIKELGNYLVDFLHNKYDSRRYNPDYIEGINTIRDMKTVDKMRDAIINIIDQDFRATQNRDYLSTKQMLLGVIFNFRTNGITKPLSLIDMQRYKNEL